MKHFALLCTAAAALSVGDTLAQTIDPTLKVYTAIEVEFATQTNQLYTLQGSADMQNWREIGGPVFGDGRTVNQIFSTRTGQAVQYDFYRLSVTANTNLSLAPWSFAGVNLSLSDDGLTEQFQFQTTNTGAKVKASGTDPFSYSFAKTAPNEVKIDLLFASGKHHVYQFKYTTAESGTYIRDEFRGTVLDDRDVGTFKVNQGAITPPPGSGGQTNAVPTERPTNLTGFAFVFQSGATPDRLEFRTATSGIEFEENLAPGEFDDPDDFTYTYTTGTNNTATLVADFGDGKRDEFALTFTQGAQGTFIRREFRDGELDDIDSGSFSPSSVVTGGNNNPPPDGTGNPPVALNGKIYRMSSGGTPDDLEFFTATTGIERDDDSSDSFTYTYTVTTATTAALVLSFEAGKWDEYDLTFTSEGSGTYLKREFDDGILDDQENGTFSTLVQP